MGDILSAASLLLTIVTVLYALWYPELNEGLKIEIPPHKEDRPGPLSKINSVIYSRALPLFMSSMLVSLVFVPDVINILKEVYEAWAQYNRAIPNYSSVKTAICIVVAFSVFISLHVGFMLKKMLDIKRNMSK